MNDDGNSHPSDGRLAAYLDGELEGRERAAVGRHLVECSACAGTIARLEEAARGFSDAVSAVEPPPTDATAAEVRRRAASRSDGEEDAVAGRVGADGPGSRWSTAARVAASVAVLLGVAAALPGSPVRSWVDRSVRQVRGLFDGAEDERAAAEAEPPPSGTDGEERSGVAVPTPEGSVRIVLRSVPAGTAVRVRLVDGDRAGVWNADGDYRTGPGRIEVASPASDTVLVEIPRSVGRARLEVNGRVAAEKRDGVLDVRIPDARLRDGEFVFRAGGT